MNCCIKLVNWPSPQSVHHHASFFFLYADGKRHSCLPVCGTCVWSCAQIPEKHRAKPCFALQTKTLLVSLDMGWESWKGGGRGAGLCQLSAMSEPISTNRLCQLRDGTWGSVVVLKYRSMSGVKVPGRCCEGEDGGGWRGGKRIGEARI